MTIVNTKKWALWPRLTSSVIWLNYIQDDAHTVLIVVSNQPLVGVGSICSDNSVAFKTAFGSLMIWDHNTGPWLELGQLRAMLFMYHLVGVENGKWFDLSCLSGWVYYLLGNIDVLPVPWKQLFDVLLFAYEALASRGTWRTVCYFLQVLDRLLNRFQVYFFANFWGCPSKASFFIFLLRVIIVFSISFDVLLCLTRAFWSAVRFRHFWCAMTHRLDYSWVARF
jgi:hypothetical protein